MENTTIPMLALRGKMVYPGTSVFFEVSRTKSLKALEEAKAQLDQYARDARLPQMMSGKPIHKIAIIYKGNELWKVEEC